ncbi:porin [Cardiobacteriaceae bacterium TAE3-ERU3]|nr:porin [Cardiobacteriaceae bacterium TAE3-ERU3]
MKKSLIALAVAAGSIAAAQADTTTLYGSIGFSSTIAKSEINTDGSAWKNTTQGVKDSLKSVKENHWNIKQDRARLGVKGTEDLSNGLQAIFQFEVQAGEGNNGIDGTRDVFVGLKGDFGTVTIGRQGSTWNTDEDYFKTSSPYKEVWAPGRESKTIKYTTPDFGGFKVAARAVADNANPASKGADQWDTSLAYEANGFMASAAYGKKLDTNPQNATISNGSTEAMGLQVGYENDQFGVVGNAQHESSANTVYNVHGKYMFDANEIRGGIGFTDAKGGNDEVAYGLGYQYNFSKRTKTWVEGVYNTVKHGDNDFTASVGIRHDF